MACWLCSAAPRCPLASRLRGRNNMTRLPHRLQQRPALCMMKPIRPLAAPLRADPLVGHMHGSHVSSRGVIPLAQVGIWPPEWVVPISALELKRRPELRIGVPGKLSGAVTVVVKPQRGAQQSSPLHTEHVFASPDAAQLSNFLRENLPLPPLGSRPVARSPRAGRPRI